MMRFFRYCWLSGFMLTLPSFALAEADAAKRGLTITLDVYNYAQVGENTLIQAEKELNRIFSKIGVETTWHNVSGSPEKEQMDPLPQRSFSSPLRILISSRSMEKWLGNSDKRALGEAVLRKSDQEFGKTVYIFGRRIQELTETLNKSYIPANQAQILALVIAHEVGHLMLPSNKDVLHSTTGIMQGRWSPSDLKSLSRAALAFTTQQGELIRAEVARRASAGVLSP